MYFPVVVVVILGLPSSKYSCEREFCPLQAVGPGGIMMKKDSDCKDVMKGVKHL